MGYYDGKVVIVTGGAKGIGSGVTRGFAAVGARVASLDIDEEAGQAIEAEAANLAGEIKFYNADVADDEVCRGGRGPVARGGGGGGGRPPPPPARYKV